MEATTDATPRPASDPKLGYLDGYSVRFERRRYGTVTYTWAIFRRDDGFEPAHASDPWPCVTPARRGLHAEALRVLWPARANAGEVAR